MSKFKYDEPQERNYIAEATDLIKGLKPSQLYDLYEHVQKQMQRSQSPERDLELKAVALVIEARKDLDRSRILARKKGYRSSMATDARAKDGNTDKYKKKA